MNKPKAIFCWSGGKDSAYCLHKVLSERSYEVCYLLTTINDKYNGEFHTFCYEGPLFKKKILFSTGEKVYKPIEVKTDNVCTS